MVGRRYGSRPRLILRMSKDRGHEAILLILDVAAMFRCSTAARSFLAGDPFLFLLSFVFLLFFSSFRFFFIRRLFRLLPAVPSKHGAGPCEPLRDSTGSFSRQETLNAKWVHYFAIRISRNNDSPSLFHRDSTISSKRVETVDRVHIRSE